jgi:hypothetical protein
MNVVKLGEVGAGQGVALKVYLDGDGRVHLGDPRVRMGANLAMFNTEQRDELIDILIMSRTAERPAPRLGELYQADSPKPKGPVEPIPR